MNALLPSTVSTTVDVLPELHTVTQDFAPAALADGRKLVDGALETVEAVRSTVESHLEAAFVLVAASHASGHGFTSSPAGHRSLQKSTLITLLVIAMPCGVRAPCHRVNRVLLVKGTQDLRAATATAASCAPPRWVTRTAARTELLREGAVTSQASTCTCT